MYLRIILASMDVLSFVVYVIICIKRRTKSLDEYAP